jgi:hypothetical protein
MTQDEEFLKDVGITPPAPEELLTEDEKALLEMQLRMILARS